MSNGDTWAGLALPLVAAGLLAIAARPGSQSNYARVTREGGTVFLSDRLMQRGYAWVDLLALVEMSFLLDDLLGVKLADEELRTLVTVGDLLGALRRHQGLNPSA